MASDGRGAVRLLEYLPGIPRLPLSTDVPHPDEKFCEGIVEETTGNKVKVKIVAGASAGETKEYKQDLVAQVSFKINHSINLHLLSINKNTIIS